MDKTSTSAPGSRVAQKWGFGMAPVKLDEQADRERAAAATVAWLRGSVWGPELEDLSLLKGLYNRVHRQDQWDWFTVWQQLGRPGRPRAQMAARYLDALRIALREGTTEQVRSTRDALLEAGIDRQLERFPAVTDLQPGLGVVYVLSTREQPRLLKIGFTSRAVEERVKEINAATGVVYPFGVRALWVVQDARDVEQQLHALLAAHRVRSDREFFEMDYKDAFRMIRDFIASQRLEQ